MLLGVATLFIKVCVAIATMIGTITTLDWLRDKCGRVFATVIALLVMAVTLFVIMGEAHG